MDASEVSRPTSKTIPNRLKAPTVLVVEDEVLVRLMIADELRHAGFNVIESANADEALCLLRSGIGATIIVSDIHMPGSIDGVGLARLVRRDFPEIKIVLASGHTQRVKSVDHHGFFPKPYDLPQIVQHVKALAD